MKTLLLLAAGLVVAMGVRAAEGAEKVQKPTVCMSYSIAKTDKANDDAVAICYDGVTEGGKAKPKLFYRFEEKEIPGQVSGRVRVLVGWR